MTTADESHRVTVLGAGVMGTGIAAMTVAHGVPVVLVDVDADVLARARAEIRGKVRHARLMGVLPGDRREGELVTSTSVSDGADATAVIEATLENADVKAKALGEAAATVPDGTPLISTTSGIPIDEMANWVPRPGELIGAHFMNPTYLINTVEVIRGDRTADSTLELVTTLFDHLNRHVVVVRDSPGFVTSRLLHPMINNAARLVGEGTASVEDIDELMRKGIGHSVGPLRTADLIGIDNLVDSLVVLHERTGDESARPCEVLLDKVREGNLGRKTGRGFYDYEGLLS
ncbi:3-hydroxyacyl-CoA dehydrogenase [Saccharomonospora piscinae]|uniref:3-hydroxyacyl-CoA dehydrogenase n=1 Tax=Saccharomonospora piscinae TaxID=687388 RepID=A0A1V8ZYD6_SACPI|nr:3-hydroxyacyl-CoA dehydrogenase family protein [Saccharomonospora piscinae]OQO89694.1 3-hydroxyacyl-CoA dehydrogenase [Saccharomonospora piscinae]TLW91373.1 3-hydroxyacyl-CoA dehydrogenase family protein [Saccharomonospora piscinae]